MIRKAHATFLIAVPLAVICSSQLAAAAPYCESLLKLHLPDTAVTAAQIVAEGQFAPPPTPVPAAANFSDVPSFCRVQATLTPSSDSDIKIEVWLPTEAHWNGKLKSLGNGGWAGTIGYPALATALRDGYVGASTDTGHTGGMGSGPSFAVGHPEKLIDFSSSEQHTGSQAIKRCTQINIPFAGKINCTGFRGV